MKIFFFIDWNIIVNENKYGYMNFNWFFVCGFYFYEEVLVEFVVVCKIILFISCVDKIVCWVFVKISLFDLIIGKL